MNRLSRCIRSSGRVKTCCISILQQSGAMIPPTESPPSSNVAHHFRVRRALLALLFAFAFTGYVQRTSVAIAAERMMPEPGLRQVQFGWLLTAFLFTYSVFQLPGALVGQWVGARRMLGGVGLATVAASVA